MNVFEKLMAARIKLHAREIKKSGRNTFANYSYMELADFLIPTQTIFAELGLCGVVSYTADTASLTITDMADPGQQIRITSPMGSAALKGCHEVQNVGAVETYQRRYLWVTAMEIVEHDALDSSPPADPTDLAPALRASLAAVEQVKTGALAAAAADAAKALDAPTKTALAKLAFEVGELFKRPDEGAALAYSRIEIDELNGDEKTYLWGMLDSKLRSALKREGQTRALKEHA